MFYADALIPCRQRLVYNQSLSDKCQNEDSALATPTASSTQCNKVVSICNITPPW